MFRGFLYHAEQNDTAERQLHFLTSKVGHAQLFDTKFPHTTIEYFDFPRGRVVFDSESGKHIIYIDKCIIEKADKIAEIFDAKDYVVKEDEHYICKNCMYDEIWE
ncbi:MAG: hypothetical protein BWY15_02288 [Firmicutes bacterium ADurb.Bin193]|nr:MAG: hypothetical protein BWY15_02288 [Firmicutes bacterium ADurb.Bin193]